MVHIINDLLNNGSGLVRGYRYGVRKAKRLAGKLENPVNQRTGNALRPMTIKQYEAELKRCRIDLMREKQAIAMLARCRLIGPRKDEDCPQDALLLRSIIERLAETTRAHAEAIGSHDRLRGSLERAERMNEHYEWMNDYYEKECNSLREERGNWQERTDHWKDKYKQATAQKPKAKKAAVVVPFKLIQGGKQPDRRPVPRGPFGSG